MIFPYWEIKRGDELRLFPLIPVTLEGSQSSLDVVALVDSGAEHSVFGEDLAERLKIDLNEASPVVVVGIGDHDVPGRLTAVKLQLGRHRWEAPVIFSPAANHQAVLGQAGFFAFFTVTFRYRRREIDIRLAR